MPIRYNERNISKIFVGDTEYKTVFKGEERIWPQNFERPLYSFSSLTFTPAGADGRFGPTLEEIQEEYSSESWTQNTNFLNITTQGIQEWTVPENGTYSIQVAGAQGGHATSTNSTQPNRRGGRGTILYGEFTLLQGEKINIIVGQEGDGRQKSGFASFNERAGGGGGSFVWKQAENLPLIVAGGGGGASGDPGTGQVGVDAVLTEAGTRSFSNNGTAGTNGNGAISAGGGFRAGAGAGFFTNGSGGGDGRDGQAALNGGVGGSCSPSSGDRYDGGFGGGGADARLNDTSADSEGTGGGGGYSGGAGGNSTSDDAGGGGGSFNIGLNQINLSGDDGNAGDGFVTITKL